MNGKLIKSFQPRIDPSDIDECEDIRVERGPQPPPDLSHKTLEMYYENYFADVLGLTLPYPHFAHYHAIMTIHRAGFTSPDSIRKAAPPGLASKPTKRK